MALGEMAFNKKRMNHRKVAVLAVVSVALFLGALCSRPAAAAQPERALAGVKIFSTSDLLIRKFGTPDEIRTGGASTGILTPGSINMGSGQQAAPGPENMGGGMGGAFTPPPMFEGGAPGAPSPDEGSSSNDTDKTTTWVYDRPDGSSLEFTLSSNGRVIQIHLTGYHSPYKTARGIALGASYGDVLRSYQYPENQNITGTVLNLNYVTKYHAAFQFINQKLVGIVVSAVE